MSAEPFTRACQKVRHCRDLFCNPADGFGRYASLRARGDNPRRSRQRTWSARTSQSHAVQMIYRTSDESPEKFVAELYGDVKYDKDGKLVIDRKKKAWTTEDTKKHISSQINDSSVAATTGEQVAIDTKDYEVSLCCHSDSPGCVEIVTMARQLVDEHNKKLGL